MEKEQILSKIAGLTPELMEESGWTSEELEAYFDTVLLERIIRTREYLVFMKAEQQGTKEAIEEAKQASKQLKQTYIANREKFEDLAEQLKLFVIVQHSKYNDSGESEMANLIMPYSLAIGEYLDFLAVENQKMHNQTIMDSFVWYPSNFPSGRDFKYWQLFQIREEESRILSESDFEFMDKFEKENNLQVNNSKSAVA